LDCGLAGNDEPSPVGQRHNNNSNSNNSQTDRQALSGPRPASNRNRIDLLKPAVAATNNNNSNITPTTPIDGLKPNIVATTSVAFVRVAGCADASQSILRFHMLIELCSIGSYIATKMV
jgi:hypothetical protein